MKARIVKGRLRVLLDEETQEEDLERIQQMIGSAGQMKGVPVVSCALSVRNLRKLKHIGCKLNPDEETVLGIAKLKTELEEYEKEVKIATAVKSGKLTIPIAENYEFKPPYKIYAHQKLGLTFLHALKKPALFGDCGTGKTGQVLGLLDSLVQSGEKWILLVTCPVNLINNVWKEDVEKFTNLSFLSLRSLLSTSNIVGEDWDDPKDPKPPRKPRNKDDKEKEKEYKKKFAQFKRERASIRKERRGDPVCRAKAKSKAKARLRKEQKKRFLQDADVYVINPENLRTDPKEALVKDLCRRKTQEGYQIIFAIDESSMMKSRTSRTYKSLSRIGKFADRRIIMTGTPASNGIADVWSQFSFLDDGQTLQSSFNDYRLDMMEERPVYGVTYDKKRFDPKTGKTETKKCQVMQWKPRAGAAKRLYDRIEPRMIRFRTEDCIDLPPKRFLVREVEMNDKQTSVYEDMEDSLFAEFNGEAITAKVFVVKLLKLRQITGGFIRTDDEKDIALGKDSPKMVELDRLLEQSIEEKIGDSGPPSKALIWAQYRWEMESLIKRYSKPYGARGLFGGISSNAKDESIRRFKKDDKCQVLVCHPQSAGHGLTLTEANYAFYYSLSYNFEEFYQSFRRMTRPGQDRKMTYYFLVCPGTIDEDLLEVVREKKNLSDIVTDGAISKDEFIARRKKLENQIKLVWEGK